MKLSVIITSYNSEDTVERAINSVKNQNYLDIEIIVVDDCSTDRTLSILERIKGIKLIRHQKNLGAGISRQDAINNSTGDYTLFLDSDDELEPGCLEYLSSIAKERDADIVFGLYRELKDDRVYVQERGFKECVGDDKFSNLSGIVPWLTGALIRRSLWRQVKYCPRRFVEDTPTLWRLLYYADIVIYTNRVCYNYYHRDESLIHSASPYKRNLFECYAILDVFLFLNQKNGGDSIIRKTGLIREFTISYTLMKMNQPLSIDKDDYQEERGFIDKFVKLFNS